MSTKNSVQGSRCLDHLAQDPAEAKVDIQLLTEQPLAGHCVEHHQQRDIQQRFQVSRAYPQPSSGGQFRGELGQGIISQVLDLP